MVKRTDSGGQVHLVTNIRKPKKWRKFEYLESSGTQYIDTGIHGSDTLKIKIKVQELLISKGKAVFGTFENNSSYYLYQSGSANEVWQIGFGSFANTSKAIDTNVHEWLFDNFNIYLDNILIGTRNVSTFTTTRSLLLFSMYKANGTLYQAVPKRIYYCLIWDNNNLIRNFVPALYNGEYGMWDLVEDRFYRNQGTGSFTAGPEIKNYDEVDEVRKVGLPYDAEVEYLESTGTQYIDTGKTFKSNIRVVFSVIYTQTITSFTQVWGLNRNGCKVAWEGNQFYFGRGYSEYSNPVKDTEYECDYDFTAGNMVAKINNTIVRRTSETQPDNSEAIYIFALNNKGTPNKYKAKHSKFKLYEKGLISLDFIPVRKGNTGYMYDKVSKQLFDNAGTGGFILGPDKEINLYKYPVWNRKLIEEPFTFRATNTKTRRRTAKLKGIKGNTVVWNQLILNGDFSDGKTMWRGNRATMTYIDGVASWTVQTAGAGPYSNGFSKWIVNHKYYVAATLKCSMLGGKILIGRTSDERQSCVLGTEFSRVSVIITRDTETTARMAFYSVGSTEKTYYMKNVICIDLTLLFGEGNEPATTAEFESWLDANVGLKDYYPFNTGKLISTQMTGIKTNGFNQFDLTTGKALLIGGIEYKVTGAYSSLIIEGTPVTLVNEKFTPEKNCELVVTGGNSNTCVHHSDIRNGKYESYWSEEKQIPVTSLTGKLNGEGNSMIAFADGMKAVGSVYDEIVSVEDVTKAIKRVSSRAYQSGDESDTNVITDNTTTYYALVTPEEYVLDDFLLPLDIPIEKGGTELILSNEFGVSPKLLLEYII